MIMFKPYIQQFCNWLFPKTEIDLLLDELNVEMCKETLNYHRISIIHLKLSNGYMVKHNYTTYSGYYYHQIAMKHYICYKKYRDLNYEENKSTDTSIL
jgi:hypothetical protein